ncbi:MAG: 3-hydroxyacyl-ACP dehydratase FabZ family protein [Pirellulales bacterium]|nr:3-hydroxyacyl-ACP dehydratase FabZ family protein [Pirellulales bacterium]
MSLAAIHAAIPHRAPFLFLDRIVRQEMNQIHCQKTLTGQEFFYQGHYPDFPLTPGVILCEACLQAGAVLLSQQSNASGKSVPVATRMNDVRWKRMVRPGETIDIEVNLVEQLADAFFMTGKVSVAGKVAARLEFACTMAEK